MCVDALAELSHCTEKSQKMYLFQFLLVFALLVLAVVAVDNTTTPTDSCSRYDKSCRHCASNFRCVWCASSKECRSGSIVGATHHSCGDYRWAQCAMPQFALFTLLSFAVICCCALAVILFCFRSVCCPRSWQSKLPSWSKVKHQHEFELDTLVQADPRRNPRTGMTTAETRAALRGKYTELGLEPNF